MSTNNAKIVVVSGPSGVGKSTLCKEVANRTGAYLSISATTRTPGENETDGREYWFISKEEFERKIESDEFLEYAKVYDNWYGTPKDKVNQALAEGKTVLLEIDTQGGLSVKKRYPDAVMLFIMPPSHRELASRMEHRGREKDDQTARKRLNNAGSEIAMAWQHYEHMVINADFETAVTEIIAILNSETGDKK